MAWEDAVGLVETPTERAEAHALMMFARAAARHHTAGKVETVERYSDDVARVHHRVRVALMYETNPSTIARWPILATGAAVTAAHAAEGMAQYQADGR